MSTIIISLSPLQHSRVSFKISFSQPKMSIKDENNDDVEITSVTPSTGDVMKGKLAMGGIQRKILPMM